MLHLLVNDTAQFTFECYWDCGEYIHVVLCTVKPHNYKQPPKLLSLGDRLWYSTLKGEGHSKKRVFLSSPIKS